MGSRKAHALECNLLVVRGVGRSEVVTGRLRVIGHAATLPCAIEGQRHPVGAPTAENARPSEQARGSVATATVATLATVGVSSAQFVSTNLGDGDESALDSRRSGCRYSLPASTWAHNPPDHRPAADFQATRARGVARRAAPGRSLFLARRRTR
jgi:hypothetical protein